MDIKFEGKHMPPPKPMLAVLIRGTQINKSETIIELDR